MPAARLSGELCVRRRADSLGVAQCPYRSTVVIKLVRSELRNLWRRSIEVAVANPSRSDAHIRDPGPMLVLETVREGAEVQLLESREFGSPRFVRYPFVLHGALVATRQSADDEGELRVAAEVVHLPSRVNRIEEELEAVRNSNTNDRGLRC